MTSKRISRVNRPWGFFYTVHQTSTMWVKTIVIDAFQKLSLQYHNERVEVWNVTSPGIRAQIGDETLDLQPGLVYTVGTGVQHRLWNPTPNARMLVEIAHGEPNELDIVRLEDAYGRIDK